MIFEKKDLLDLLNRAIEKDGIISKIDIQLKETDALLKISWWDWRKLLNTFELLVMWEDEKIIITDLTNRTKMQWPYLSWYHITTKLVRWKIISAWLWWSNWTKFMNDLKLPKWWYCHRTDGVKFNEGNRWDYGAS